ncbi:MAG TPA: CocE/NonD family hydrolase [Solirubrobacteraceae bacterium]|nr:CocE/NonD family hydrolase [Solirubrobacteraceae bacterium]
MEASPRGHGFTIGLARVLALALTLTAVFMASDAHASVSICNVPITVSDGTVLRANIYLPASTGHYPTVLTATGYNKDVANPTGQDCESSPGIAGDEPALTEKGFAVMVLDDRGTGASGGKWDSWGPRTQEDYGELLDWIQAQSWSNKGVATTGESYMGITSLLIAEADTKRVAEGKPRAVQAVWADIPMADAYRDVTFQGGALDSGFMPLWLGLVTGLSDLPPSSLSSNPEEAARVYLEHVFGNAEFSLGKLLGATLGEEAAYDGPFYQLRSPVVRAAEITVPVVIQGGWWDLFQRGEPLLWESLKSSRDRVLIMSPHYHVTEGPALEDPNLKQEWFSHWLLKAKNGVQKTPKVNLYSINGEHWEHFKRFPLPKTKYTRMYLSGAASGSSPLSLHDGSLATTTPPAGEAGETEPLLPASSPCSRMTAQWTAGAGSNALCDTNNQTYEATALTYTTAPMQADTKITGLISADLWAKLSSTDATLVAVLSEVEPSGASNEITGGFLLASQRAIDPALSTYGPKHVMIRPWHPFTKESQHAVTPGEATEYDVEIYPTSAIVKAGDRLRLTLGTANTFTTLTPLPDLGQELGGTLTLLHDPQHPSNVLLPSAP